MLPIRRRTDLESGRDERAAHLQLQRCGQASTTSASRVIRMVVGSFGQAVVQATHPFIVVEGEQVLASFNTLESAEDFITVQGSYSASVLRHSGQKWVMTKARQVSPLLAHSKFALHRHKKT
jgi:hypothetical protein